MRLLVLTLVCLSVFSAHAQAPLTSPLIATTSASLDRMVLYDLNGTRRELQFDSRLHFVWGFSPDGCRVIFTLSERGGVSRIYSARLDGSDRRALVQLANLPAEDWSAWEPSVNPVDGRVAFTLWQREQVGTAQPEVSYHIAWVPGEGGLPQLYSVSGAERTPFWSPNGAWLTYVAFDGRIPGPDIFATAPPTQAAVGTPFPDEQLLNEADLWVVSVDAATKYRLTAFPIGSTAYPRWSPDSGLLGFVFSPTPNNDTLWMIGNADAAAPTQLSFEWSLMIDMTWMPDGSALLASLRDFQGMSTNRLWRVPLVGSADTDATLLDIDPAINIYVDYPRFSADGRYLALRSEYRLAVVDMQTRGWQWVDETLPANTPPVWSPLGFGGEAACTG